jgi:hypothetical protein
MSFFSWTKVVVHNFNSPSHNLSFLVFIIKNCIRTLKSLLTLPKLDPIHIVG